jgi:capsular exopolysaccharide synthesis family protein
MSKFFKALEQAERDRANQEAGAPPDPGFGRPLDSQHAETPTFRQPAPRAPVPPASDRSPLREPDAARRATWRWGPTEAQLPPGEPRDLPRIDEHLVSFLDPAGFESEQYRALRHLVEHLRKTAELAVTAISSPGDGDGKTTTAINLAGALAQAPTARVLLIDADLRRSTVLGRLGEPDRSGLVDAVLKPALSLDDVVQVLPDLNLSVLPAGQRADKPYETLKSPRIPELLGEARRRYDYVILDTPPIVPVPDCRILEKLVDGVVLVVGANWTPRRMVEEALTLLDSTKLVGLVFNKDAHPPSGYYSPYSSGLTRNGHGRWWSRAGQAMGMRDRRAS